MMRSWTLRIPFGILCAMISGCSGGNSGPVQTAMAPTATAPQQPGSQTEPSPGTAWVYDATLTSTTVPGTTVPLTGPLTIRFSGSEVYRGSSYSAADASGCEFPNAITTYYTWTGNQLLETAETDALLPVIPGCVAPKREAILNEAVQFISASQASGIASLYQCSASNGTSNWSLTVTDGGATVTTVPAGKFSTHVWEAVWKFGANERDFTIYAFGSDIIERETSELNSGKPFATYSIKLRSGPTNVVIPPPPIMYPYDF